MKKFALVLHLSLALVMLIFGIVYLTSQQFLPYHGVALGREWGKLEHPLQIVILAFMRAVAGGLLGGGILVAFLQLKFHKERTQWLPWAIFLAGLIPSLSSIYATALVKFNTQGQPPFILTLLIGLLTLVGFVINRNSLLR